MITAKDIRNTNFKASDQIMLDTNIWIYLQGPQGNPTDYTIRVYSQAVADMIAAKCQIVINALIISEFVNTYARIEFNLIKQPGDDFKTFRNSPAFKPIAAHIANEVRGIFAISHRIDCGFSNLNHADLVNEFADGNSDFNDLLIADICKKNNYRLVTHDGDFCGSDLNILTMSRRLLKQ